MSTPEKVTFPSRAYKLAGLFYPPVAGSPDRAGASIVIAHPWTSIKEQSPANYARVLTQAGFTCLTYDAAYQGESEGEPRDLEDPYQRVEDIKCAVTYLVGRKEVDSNKIGVLGICASGGYAPFAAQTDLRIKAVATSAAVCVGTMARRGFDKDSSNREILKTQLEAAGKDRNSDLGGEKIPAVHMLPEKPEDAPAEMPESFRDLMSYYRTPRAFHPRATNTTLARGWDIMANFDAFAHNYLISPRPLLMITGTKAATKWQSEEGVQKAHDPKELFVIDGLTHADLYDKVDEAGAKLVDFFGKSLV
ncbi:X-pro dipeptidyl-peptidase (S15 family) protein [Penicillium chermesinum]|uniref:X-pro dipeptidyl-peptidase (S15 family) protein n=1 Tax=Penicillium chermesinum TaxID=63820 RepID=A0A9W9NU44_9EURO|nr:X-pro dipeptidyl-peptidase (S15 family) protein [Penicillium chermesinum]KAJ5226200.1 X-pro dipeptidyl-peptidase (S15 family) protein [Penicillium chermesinum]